MDSVHCMLDADYTPVAKAVVPFVKASGNMQVNNGKFILKPGQRVQINLTLGFQGTTDAVNINLHLKDFTNDIIIQAINTIHDTEQYEYPMVGTAQYTNETEQDCEVGLLVNVIYRNDTMRSWTTSLTVHEIGRAMTIPNEGLTELPIATTDTLGGIKVGEGLEINEDGILSALGGSGASQTVLFEGEINANGNITLQENIEEFDYILVGNGYYSSEKKREKPLSCISVKKIISNGYNANDLYMLDSGAVDPTGTNFTTVWFSCVANNQLQFTLNQNGGLVPYVDVIYGIKLGSNGGSGYKEVELLEQPLSFKLGRHGLAEGDVPGLYNLKDSIYNYNQLHIIAELEPDPVVSTQSGYYQRSTHVENVNSIIFNNADVSSSNGSRMFINIVDSTTANHTLCYWFKDDKTFRTIFCKSSNDVGTYSHMRIASIKGIKY